MCQRPGHGRWSPWRPLPRAASPLRRGRSRPTSRAASRRCSQRGATRRANGPRSRSGRAPRASPCSPSVWAQNRSACGATTSSFGIHAGPARTVAWHRTLALRIPSGPSGLYFARLTTADGRLGYAVSSCGPAASGRAGRDRRADEHLAGLQLPRRRRQRRRRHLVRRPLSTTASTSHGRSWPRRPAALPPLRPRRFCAGSPGGPAGGLPSDDDIERTSGEGARELYDLVVFPGHEEYVTTALLARSSSTATSAATSRSSRRTTSSTGSTFAARGSTGPAAGAMSAAPTQP